MERLESRDPPFRGVSTLLLRVLLALRTEGTVPAEARLSGSLLYDARERDLREPAESDFGIRFLGFDVLVLLIVLLEVGGAEALNLLSGTPPTSERAPASDSSAKSIVAGFGLFRLVRVNISVIKTSSDKLF